ncbi:hypothetical protein MBLNU230_g6176t1 [Neophaeotheca triangularis]
MSSAQNHNYKRLTNGQSHDDPEGQSTSVELREIPSASVPGYLSVHSFWPYGDESREALTLESGTGRNSDIPQEEPNSLAELQEPPRARAASYMSTQKLLPHVDESEQSLLPQTESGHSAKPGPSATTVTHRETAAIRERKKKWKGWRFGVTMASISTFLVMVVNLAVTIWIVVRRNNNEDVNFVVDGYGEIHEEPGEIFTAFSGNCQTVTWLSIALHLLINILSSTMLSASNYSMQCLTAPTRDEIDKAHMDGRWLDIGVASLRNLFRVKRARTVLWFVLGFTSIPIHLLYNSAVFKTANAEIYSMAAVNEDFFKSELTGNWSMVNARNGRLAWSTYAPAVNSLQRRFTYHDIYKNRSYVENITDPAECISKHATNFLTGRSNLLAITREPGDVPEQTVFAYSELNGGVRIGDDTKQNTHRWICTDIEQDDRHQCSPSTIEASGKPWTLGGKRIDYCLSELKPEGCKLQISDTILIVVVACNAIKTVAMLVALWIGKIPSLVTLGDAVASYLDRPDELAGNLCLLSKNGAVARPKSTQPNHQQSSGHVHRNVRQRWLAAVSLRRWSSALTLCILALVTTSILLSTALTTVAEWMGLNALNAFLDTGFGRADTRLLVDTGLPALGVSALLAHVLLVNLPQAIVSFLYFMYNGVLTSMLLAHEWSTYAVERKGLRVTVEHGSQRSTYWLQLPYQYSITLIISTTVLHTLISQALFLTRIDFVKDDLEQLEWKITAAGFSPPAILACIVLGSIMLLALVGLGFRKFASTMPVAGSCSLAIAAACHPPADDVDAAFLPVQWGVVGTGDEDGQNGVGHCSFTSQAVSEPIPGRRYAGLAPDRDGPGGARKRR